MAGAAAVTPRAPMTGTPYPTDMALSSREWQNWMRDNTINCSKGIAYDFTQYSSLAAGTTFASFVLPAGFTQVVGEGYRFKAWGVTAATANNKTVGFSFGGNALIGSGALAANAKPWVVKGEIFYTGGQGWEYFCEGFANGAIIVPTEGQVTVDPTAAITFLTTCTAATADADCLQKALYVEFIDQFNYTTQR